jgi:7-cyano-7-deazaguanine reductase
MDRAPGRAQIGLAAGATLPFDGVDAWTAWELAWLDTDGRPRVAVARIEVPASSPRIVESKSVKLVLNSLAHERHATPDALAAVVAGDLGDAIGATVAVTLSRPPDWTGLARAPAPGASIDEAPLDRVPDAPDASRLATSTFEGAETLHTTLFRSICPVTAQPDYATVSIRYRGPRIDRGALLAYLVAFRRHAAFHETCVERIFVDLAAACRPKALAVEARFTRRGGIDIAPFRTNEASWAPARAPDLRQ